MEYYLTKSNPNTFRLKDYLATHPTDSRWTICKNAKAGDTLYIGLSGSEAGIYAKATVTLKPIFAGEDSDFWVSPEEAAKQRWRTDIEISQIRSPILERNLITIPELKRVAKWLHLQGGACHLTEKEAEALDRLITTS